MCACTRLAAGRTTLTEVTNAPLYIATALWKPIATPRSRDCNLIYIPAWHIHVLRSAAKCRPPRQAPSVWRTTQNTGVKPLIGWNMSNQPTWSLMCRFAMRTVLSAISTQNSQNADVCMYRLTTYMVTFAAESVQVQHSHGFSRSMA